MKKILMLILAVFRRPKAEPPTESSEANNGFRVHQYNEHAYLVQQYEGRDGWGTVHADDRILDKMGLHRRVHAIFDDAKHAEIYMEEHKKLYMAEHAGATTC